MLLLQLYSGIPEIVDFATTIVSKMILNQGTGSGVGKEMGIHWQVAMWLRRKELDI